MVRFDMSKVVCYDDVDAFAEDEKLYLCKGISKPQRMGRPIEDKEILVFLYVREDALVLRLGNYTMQDRDVRYWAGMTDVANAWKVLDGVEEESE